MDGMWDGIFIVISFYLIAHFWGWFKSFFNFFIIICHNYNSIVYSSEHRD